MAFREVIQIGDPALKSENKQIEDFNDPKVKQLIEDLKDTMLTKSIIGIAGPQIAENYTIFVTEPRATETRPADQADEFRVYINPEIVYFSPEEVIIYEGCGSVANSNIFGPVKRPKLIEINAYDENNKKFSLKCDGLLARVIQHEYDHLFGIEFTEKIHDYKKMMNIENYIKYIKPLPEEKEAQRLTIKEFKWL